MLISNIKDNMEGLNKLNFSQCKNTHTNFTAWIRAKLKQPLKN